MRSFVAPLLLLSVALVPVALVGACGDDTDHLFSTGGATSAATTEASSTTGNPVTAPASSSTGTFTDCQHCVAPDTICVDDMACANACPQGRAECITETPVAPNPPITECCPEGSTCCAGVGHDVCGPPGQGCPLVCPDGTTCPTDNLCQLDPATSTYTCVETNDCPNAMKCDGNICCPLGSKCDNGTCPLPDLSIDQAYLTDSIEVVDQEFGPNACSITEGCVAGPGNRHLLKFSLRSPNTGDGDLFLGNPNNNDLFVFSDCHMHYHFTSYAQYRLLDQGGNLVATGHKQAFCLLDFDPLTGTTTPGIYNCGFQGIQAGWSDIYDRDLPCQYVDVTDVPTGDYVLQVDLNFDHILAEADYTNNMATFPVHIDAQEPTP